MERVSLIQNVVELAEKLYDVVLPDLPGEWLSLDLTMPQVRLLLLLYRSGPSPMSALASDAGIALSTATGAVDQLVNRELIVRESHPQDRRLVICQLSGKGRELASKLWRLGRIQIEKLLESMTKYQLHTIRNALKYLNAAANMNKKNG